jgi:hypothetical protein
VNELSKCGGCQDFLTLHCDSENCDWMVCRDCRYIFSDSGVIPTWERYVAEGRDTA